MRSHLGLTPGWWIVSPRKVTLEEQEAEKVPPPVAGEWAHTPLSLPLAECSQASV